MKFVDEAVIRVKAGDGGHGAVSFRREKFVPKGGPDGGDGGKGGDVVIVAERSLSSLKDFKYRRFYKAENGRNGGGRNRTGRDGIDVLISVPLGTVVRDVDEDRLLCDMTESGQHTPIARGGKGGRGNSRFTSSTHRAPMEHDPGEAGEERNLGLELKLLADVGIVGLPNAGKSTLISRLTEAKPKVGDYPFTSLMPTLGVMRNETRTLVLADIPGIIKGASQGKGLGLTFLRHIERADMLVWIIDMAAGSVAADYEELLKEMKAYRESLLMKRRIVVLNKIDLVPSAVVRRVAGTLSRKGETVLALSALTGDGLEALRKVLDEKESGFSHG
jgi:GTPase